MFEVDLEDSRFDYAYTNAIDDQLEQIAMIWCGEKFNIHSLFKVDKFIYQIYRENSANFALIPFQLLIYCLHGLKEGNKISNIEKTIGDGVAKLAEKYPPSCLNEEVKDFVALKSF